MKFTQQLFLRKQEEKQDQGRLFNCLKPAKQSQEKKEKKFQKTQAQQTKPLK